MADRAPAVSVAMKSYNHAAYVGDAIRSVLAQTFGDFELLITDDGSTDATPEIIASFKDDRIRFERFPENRGIAVAMDATVRRARGDYVAILNSDDLALPGRLERQVAYLNAHPEIAAVFCVPQEIDDLGRPTPPSGIFRIPFPGGAASRAEWLRHFFFHGNCLCAPSAMIRREVFLDLGADDPRFSLLMDFDRWIRMLTRHEMYVMEEPVTAFRWRADRGNASAATVPTMLRNAFESLQILRRYRAFSPELLRSIFAADIARSGIDTERPNPTWLAEIALLGDHPWHRLFALESLFETATGQRDFRRLQELSGTLDVFGLDRPAGG